MGPGEPSNPWVPLSCVSLLFLQDPTRIRDSKNGSLEAALEPGTDFHTSWMEEVDVEETKYNKKNKRTNAPALKDADADSDDSDCDVVESVGRGSTGSAVGFISGQLQELCGIWWPDYVFEREEGRKLTAEEEKTEILEGRKRKGCWRFDKGAADVVGAIKVMNVLGRPHLKQFEESPV